MSNRILPLVFWPLCAITGVSALGDVITLKDGRQITGKVQSGGGKQILIKTGAESQVIDVSQIRSIDFDPPPGAVSATPENAPPAPQLTAARPSASPAQPTDSARIAVPAGTEIAVRTLDRIDSKTADKNKEYSASLDDPVVVDGVTLIPENAGAILRVSDVKSAGFARRASLSLVLVAVTINGRRVNVETDKIDSQSGSQAKRTAAAAGGGAAAGAAVGAAAGGAVGAGIGAGVGAAAGAVAGKVYGKEVEIRPETRFTYKLAEPVVIENQEKSR